MRTPDLLTTANGSLELLDALSGVEVLAGADVPRGFWPQAVKSRAVAQNNRRVVLSTNRRLGAYIVGGARLPRSREGACNPRFASTLAPPAGSWSLCMVAKAGELSRHFVTPTRRGASDRKIRDFISSPQTTFAAVETNPVLCCSRRSWSAARNCRRSHSPNQ